MSPAAHQNSRAAICGEGLLILITRMILALHVEAYQEASAGTTANNEALRGAGHSVPELPVVKVTQQAVRKMDGRVKRGRRKMPTSADQSHCR